MRKVLSLLFSLTGSLRNGHSSSSLLLWWDALAMLFLSVQRWTFFFPFLSSSSRHHEKERTKKETREERGDFNEWICFFAFCFFCCFVGSHILLSLFPNLLQQKASITYSWMYMGLYIHVCTRLHSMFTCVACRTSVWSDCLRFVHVSWP